MSVIYEQPQSELYSLGLENLPSEKQLSCMCLFNSLFKCILELPTCLPLVVYNNCQEPENRIVYSMYPTLEHPTHRFSCCYSE